MNAITLMFVWVALAIVCCLIWALVKELEKRP